MLADEPRLKLVGTEDIGDGKVVGAVVASFIGRISDLLAVFHDDPVRLEEAGDLHRDLFSTTRGGRNLAYLGYITAHGDADAAEELNAFRNRINEFNLLFEVLVEQEVELVEGTSWRVPSRRGNGACPG